MKFDLRHGASTLDLLINSANVLDSLDNIAGTCLTLGANHGGTFLDTAKSLS